MKIYKIQSRFIDLSFEDKHNFTQALKAIIEAREEELNQGIVNAEIKIIIGKSPILGLEEK